MGILRDLNTYLQSPLVDSAALLHPLHRGHTHYRLRKQWGWGHTDTPYVSVGPSLHPQLSVRLDRVPVLGAVQSWGP